MWECGVEIGRGGEKWGWGWDWVGIEGMWLLLIVRFLIWVFLWFVVNYIVEIGCCDCWVWKLDMVFGGMLIMVGWLGVC